MVYCEYELSGEDYSESEWRMGRNGVKQTDMEVEGMMIQADFAVVIAVTDDGNLDRSSFDFAGSIHTVYTVVYRVLICNLFFMMFKVYRVTISNQFP